MTSATAGVTAAASDAASTVAKVGNEAVQSAEEPGRPSPRQQATVRSMN